MVIIEFFFILSYASNILITGGTGFIGSHTAVELLLSGYNVTIIDNLMNSKQSVINQIEAITEREVLFYKIDCTNKTALDPLFQEHKFDAIIHMAGFKSVSESIMSPLDYYENNLRLYEKQLKISKILDKVDIKIKKEIEEIL